jgi:UV DNA damage endonuclease
MRLGLCCIFQNEPIKFRTTTATALMKLSRVEALKKVSDLCLTNADALMSALHYCHAKRIGAFRINSGILPVKTHPKAGYQIDDLPQADLIRERFRACGAFAQECDIRTLFHPDQFTLLSSADSGITERSIADLVYQAEVCEWVGADVINIHGGGAYGDKASALARVEAHIRHLPQNVRQRLTLENDDKVYTPDDLFPLCERTKTPLIYDVHHHRCLPDGQSVKDATQRAIATWNREPVFHISSPKEGWDGPRPSRHHDYISLRDFPNEWYGLDVTIEIEAKAKELAVQRMAKDLETMTCVA